MITLRLHDTRPLEAVKAMASRPAGRLGMATSRCAGLRQHRSQRNSRDFIGDIFVMWSFKTNKSYEIGDPSRREDETTAFGNEDVFLGL